MMREAASVRLTWSVAVGPASGGVGGRPPGFLPVAFSWAWRFATFSSNAAFSRA